MKWDRDHPLSVWGVMALSTIELILSSPSGSPASVTQGRGIYPNKKRFGWLMQGVMVDRDYSCVIMIK